jgi:dolichol-phosphate mannosyltransferase
MNGATVTELEVNHFPRIHGKSNYGLERVFKVILDLMVVKFLDRYYQKPMHIFGGVGLFAIAISLISGAYALYLKLFVFIDFIRTPLPLLSVISLLAGLTCFLLGLIAELITRSWHEPLGKNQFQIKMITKHGNISSN